MIFHQDHCGPRSQKVSIVRDHARSLPHRRRSPISERCSRVRFRFVIKGFLPSRYGQRGQPLRSQCLTNFICPPMQSTQLARIAFKGEVIDSAGSWSDFIFHLPGDAMPPTWRPNLLYQRLGRLAASSSLRASFNYRLRGCLLSGYERLT